MSAQQLPFDDHSVDIIVCSFGYMFVPDKPKAFEEAYRVLRPGGMLIFSTWDKLESNGASDTYRKLVKNFLKESLPDTYNLPYSMNDQAAIKKMLQDGSVLFCKSFNNIPFFSKTIKEPQPKQNLLITKN